jgi:hypothetical protein
MSLHQPDSAFECMNWEIFLYDFPGPVMCTLRAFESAAFRIKSNYLSVISSEPAQAAPTDHNVTFSGMCSSSLLWAVLWEVQCEKLNAASLHKGGYPCHCGSHVTLTLGVSLAVVVLPLWPPRGHDMGRPKQYLA